MPKRTGNPNKPKAPWKHLVQAQRREAAELRQAEYDKLSPSERLAKLDRLHLTAKKERAKLTAAIKEGK